MSLVFKLFISPSFDDFEKEREMLSRTVFPKIKRYCKQRNVKFEPIFLHWGVNDAAYPDRNVLETCLKEAHSSKIFPHPTFLVMLGDRSGWVPLPYVIKKEIFERLLKKMTRSDKALVLAWYGLDVNAMVEGYFLRDTVEDYTRYTYCEQEERYVCKILQKAAQKSKLTEEEKRPFFLTAAEAEEEKGILPFISPLPFQKTDLHCTFDALEIDSQYIFALLRDVDKATQQGNFFITNAKEYQQAQASKVRVKGLLDETSYVHVKTKQIDETTLERAYLLLFKKRIEAFIKNKIDTFLMTFKEEHEQAINDAQVLIQLKKTSSYSLINEEGLIQDSEGNTRYESYLYGELYAKLVVEFYVRYHDQEKIQACAEFVVGLKHRKWICYFLNILDQMGYDEAELNNKEDARASYQFHQRITELLYHEAPEEWAKMHTKSMNNLAKYR